MQWRARSPTRSCCFRLCSGGSGRNQQKGSAGKEHKRGRNELSIRSRLPYVWPVGTTDYHGYEATGRAAGRQSENRKRDKRDQIFGKRFFRGRKRTQARRIRTPGQRQFDHRDRAAPALFTRFERTARNVPPAERCLSSPPLVRLGLGEKRVKGPSGGFPMTTLEHPVFALTGTLHCSLTRRRLLRACVLSFKPAFRILRATRQAPRLRAFKHASLSRLLTCQWHLCRTASSWSRA